MGKEQAVKKKEYRGSFYIVNLTFHSFDIPSITEISPVVKQFWYCLATGLIEYYITAPPDGKT